MIDLTAEIAAVRDDWRKKDARFSQAMEILGPDATGEDITEWTVAQDYLEELARDPERAEGWLRFARLIGIYRRSDPPAGRFIPPPELPREKPAVRFADQPLFRSPAAARRYLESRRWHNGVSCPHCGQLGKSTRLRARRGSARPARPGLRKCRACKQQFSVTVGTMFTGSHLPLHLWLRAILRLCDCNDLATAADLKRVLPVSYPTARYIRDRIQWAMRQEPLRSALAEITSRCRWNLTRPWPRPHTGKPNRYPRPTSFPFHFHQVIDLLLRVPPRNSI
jgi:transposase-like protein